MRIANAMTLNFVLTLEVSLKKHPIDVTSRYNVNKYIKRSKKIKYLLCNDYRGHEGDRTRTRNIFTNFLNVDVSKERSTQFYIVRLRLRS